jgi:TIR domain
MIHVMKVFISWSGDASYKAAIALREWLPSVLQSLEPYVSSEDIEKGARWSSDIGQRLNDTEFGVLCVTRENLSSAWLNFEAGALSKSIDTGRVSPLLLNLRPAELVGPLSQFQVTLPHFEDIVRLVKSMNTACERPIEEARLVEAIKMWWPKLGASLKEAARGDDQAHPAPQRDIREMIEELLEITRGIQRRAINVDVDEPYDQPGELARLIQAASLRPREREDLLNAFDAAVRELGLETHSLYFRDNAVYIRFAGRPNKKAVAVLQGLADVHSVKLELEVAQPL